MPFGKRTYGPTVIGLILGTCIAIAAEPGQAPAGRQTRATPPKAPVAASGGMTNEDVVKLAAAGLSDDLIVASIRRAEAHAFDLSVDGLITLKKAKVSDVVITAMVGAADGASRRREPAVAPAVAAPVAAPTAAPAVVAAVAPSAAPVQEIGVYFMKDDRWQEFNTEVVNWKTGGVLKNLASMKVIGKDINGTVNQPTSQLAITNGTKILIYTADGVSAAEYQLLRLHPKDDHREFRTVTGGVLHSSGGALRDLVPFESKKVGVRLNEVTLPNLGPGEYGFLAPGGASSASASSQLGKIYSFRVQ